MESFQLCHPTLDTTLTCGYVQALHGQLPVVVAGVVEAALADGVVRQLLEDPHRLVLQTRLVECCNTQALGSFISKHCTVQMPTCIAERPTLFELVNPNWSGVRQGQASASPEARVHLRPYS